MKEIKKTRKIQEMEEEALLKAYIHEIDKIKLLTKDEEEDLARRMTQGDNTSKEKLIQANLKFVISIAKQYMNKGVSFLDLISEGNMGLIMAANKYDYKKGYKFISYAVWWIRQYIAKAFLEQSKLIRLPFNRKLQFYKIKNLQKEKALIEIEMSNEEIARHLDMKERDVNNIMEATKDYLSIYSTIVNGKKEITLSDLLLDTKYKIPEDIAVEESLKDSINKALRLLSDREQLIIRYRFGLNGFEHLSLSKIAERLNVTKERIRQIEKRAINKLKNISFSKDLKIYLAA